MGLGFWHANHIIMKKTFLLADDDVDDIQLFCEALSLVDSSIVCHCATSGQEALDFLDTIETPNIIFLDINMPGMNGWECLEKVKNSEKYSHIPVLVYSTSKQQEDVNTALDLGALCFFAKPNSFSELKSILEVIAANVHTDLLSAISHFNHIKSKKVFACSDQG